MRIKTDGTPTEDICRDVTDSDEEGKELWENESSRRQDENFRSSRRGNFLPSPGI